MTGSRDAEAAWRALIGGTGAPKHDSSTNAWIRRYREHQGR